MRLGALRRGLPAPALRAYLQRIAQLARVMAPHAVVVALFLSFLTLTKVYSVISPELPFWSVLMPVVIVQVAIAIGSLYAGMLMGGAFPFAGWKHVAALASGAVAGLWLADLDAFQPTGYPWDAALRWHIVESEASWHAYGLWTMLATALLLIVFYAARDREARIARASRGAEVERAFAQRAVVESRLQVLQARVEPEFLFDALADARRLYERSPPAADKLLDALIAYLRAALPQMRGEASTLGGEALLSDAYLAVAPAVREGRMRIDVRIDPGVASLPFPPMVLLPLAQGMATADARLAVLEAKRDANDTRIVFRVDAAFAPPEWSDEKLSALRETLAHFYGDRAHIGRYVREGNWTVEVRIPAASAFADTATGFMAKGENATPDAAQGNGKGGDKDGSG